MSYLVAFLAVAISGVLAALASVAVGRSVALERRRRLHDVGIAVFSQIGIMLSVLLAFVFSQVWGEYRLAAIAISEECAALHGAAILSSGLSDGQGQPVIRAIATYANAVAQTEWPLMRQRQRSLLAERDLEALLRQAANLKPASELETVTQAQVVSLLTAAHESRETRTFQLAAAAPPLLWVMLIAMSAIMVLFVVGAGVERPTHMVFAGVFAASVAMVLVVVRMLDLPFEGALALPDADFLKLVAQVSSLIPATPPAG
jgi:hypothetical protein